MNPVTHRFRAFIVPCVAALTILSGCMLEAMIAAPLAVIEIATPRPECEKPPPARFYVKPTDMVLGMGPAREITLRLKKICATRVDEWELLMTFPVGDYEASYVDETSVFFKAPGGVTITRRDTNVSVEGGIRVPFDAGGYLNLSVWRNECERQLPGFVAVKKPMPTQCSLPYGKVIVFVRDGVEIVPADINRPTSNAKTPGSEALPR